MPKSFVKLDMVPEIPGMTPFSIVVKATITISAITRLTIIYSTLIKSSPYNS